MRKKDDAPGIQRLSPEEVEMVAGGMMKQAGEAPPKTGDDGGTTWVPVGTVKVYLAGVQQN